MVSGETRFRIEVQLRSLVKEDCFTESRPKSHKL